MFVFLNYKTFRVPATSMLPDSETNAIQRLLRRSYSGGGYVDVQRRTKPNTGVDSYVVIVYD
jgi:hypothetical protein